MPTQYVLWSAWAIVASAWLSPFIRTSETTPIIRVTLEPPETPYPQVAELRTQLEKDRLALEVKYFETLEKSFDKELTSSRTQVEKVIANALKVLEDRSTLELVAKGSLQKRPARPLSFLQSTGISSTIKQRLSNVNVPSVNVELVDQWSPDPKIEAKMRQIEQKRNSREKAMFDRAVKTFQNITTIFIEETKKNLQIQLNAFMVDAKAVSSAVTKVQGSARFQEVRSAPLAPVDASHSVLKDGPIRLHQPIQNIELFGDLDMPMLW